MIVDSKIKKTIKVVLADDHPMLMTGLSAALHKIGIEVLGVATTPAEAVRMYFDVKPDVLILDIKFGVEFTGLDAAKEILKQAPNAKLIFFSQFDRGALIKEAYRIGACSFIMKSCEEAQLATAVSYANEGKRYFSPEVSELFASWALKGDASPLTRLDTREYDIFMMMARGLSNVEIAQKTNLSTKTVSINTQEIKAKLGATRNADLTMLAMTLGLVSFDASDLKKREDR